MEKFLLMDQENIGLRPSGKLSSAILKRNIRNCPTSASKRPALNSLTNHHHVKDTSVMEEVSLPPHLDPLLALPSSIPSLVRPLPGCTAAPLRTTFSTFSPDSPMLVCSPVEYFSPPLINFDLLDDDFASHYSSDIFAHLKQSESYLHPGNNYIRRQPDITNTMRAILVDWLVEVCDEFNLLPETLYIAVAYTDRYLSSVSVPRSKLQLVGVTSLYLASKFEEIYPPDIGEFAYITDDTYTKKEIVKMEQDILKTLNFQLVQPTIFTFLLRFVKLSTTTSSGGSNSIEQQLDLLSKYICELALQDGDPFLKYLPSMIAGSAVCLARHCLGLIAWPPLLEYYSGYNVAAISHCIQDLHRTHAMAHCHPQQAIRQKYASDKLFRIATLKSPETLPI